MLYLQLNGGIKMAISSQQNLDGNEVITCAKKRNGNITYITDRVQIIYLLIDLVANYRYTCVMNILYSTNTH